MSATDLYEEGKYFWKCFFLVIFFGLGWLFAVWGDSAYNHHDFFNGNVMGGLSMFFFLLFLCQLLLSIFASG